MLHRSSSTFQRCAHRRFLGKSGVLLCAYPLGSGLRLRPAHKVIARRKRGAAPKVRMARTVLFKQHVHARRNQGRNQEVVAMSLP